MFWFVSCNEHRYCILEKRQKKQSKMGVFWPVSADGEPKHETERRRREPRTDRSQQRQESRRELSFLTKARRTKSAESGPFCRDSL